MQFNSGIASAMRVSVETGEGARHRCAVVRGADADLR